MPDSRRHRGAHPEDARLFGTAESQRLLRLAAGDLAWLLGRRYAPEAALTLVGNRYQLRQRQRQALSRAVTAPAVARARRARQVQSEALTGAALHVDALNQLITVEVALAGGVLLRGHDGALRDLASVHGTYRAMAETSRAVHALGTWLAPLQPGEVVFFIDAQVSNSGRLAGMLRTMAAAHGWPWQARLVPNTDAILLQTSEIVATSDRQILDHAMRWYGLAAAVVLRVAPQAWYVDLDVAPPTVC
jgi:hypothetical protein